MSTLTISLPDSVRRRIESLAESDGVSLDDFVASVLSQRVAIADADSYVQRRAARGSAAQMLEILQAAPPAEPEERDRLP
jgi:predicted transcriptional regulator